MYTGLVDILHSISLEILATLANHFKPSIIQNMMVVIRADALESLINYPLVDYVDYANYPVPMPLRHGHKSSKERPQV